MMQKFRVSSIDIKRCTMRVRVQWVNEWSPTPSCSCVLLLLLVLISNHDMPKLVIRSETGESISHDLAEESYTIGRAPENSIRLEDNSVSGRHAEIVVSDQNILLKDLGSTNGTVVHGQPVTEAQLRA